MKKILSVVIAAVMVVLCLAGCGEKKLDRLNYIKGVEKYIELCDLENITVDCNSKEYKEIEDNLLSSDFSAYTYEVKEGKVAEGDIANIDYAGKVNGVAFTGGTSTGYDLTIGSDTFIEGFEDQLIGVAVGQTVDVNVTFPADYGDSTDLATGKEKITLSGAKAVFTVKVNKIARPYSEVNDEFAKKAGFENAEAYNKDLKDRAVKNSIYTYIMSNCKVDELPSDKDGNCYEYHKTYYTDLATSNGMTFADLLSYYQITESAFKTEVLTEEIICYGIFDKLGLVVTKEAVDAEVKELAEMNSTTAETIVKEYGNNFLEFVYVNNTMMEKLAEMVKVTEKS